MPINARHHPRRLFRLRTILLVVMLSVLLLPVASILVFRFYENELVRRTELQLIAQAAVLSAVYRDLRGAGAKRVNRYTPIEPRLDLAIHSVFPRRDDARNAPSPASALSQQAGQRMQKIILNSQQYTLAGIRILDENGIVIAGRSEMGQSLVHIREVRRALDGKYNAVIRERISDEPPLPLASISRGTGIRVFVAFPILSGSKVLGVAYLSRTPQNILKHMYQIRYKLALLSMLVLLSTGLLVLFISARLSRPIRELIQQTQRVTRGEAQTVRMLQEPGTYELAQLSNSFAEMSEALHERSTYIDQFASHVSHEFKTPLTSMQGALELLQEHNDSMPPEQRQRFLDNLFEDTQRLRRLVNRLLEQARADALQPSAERSELLSTLAALQGRYGDRGLTLNYQLYDTQQAKRSDEEVFLSIAPVSLETVLGNLLENSLQHGSDRVQAEIYMQGNTCKIVLADNGSGISVANRDKVFTPFFTTQRDSGGTGLGLGIVQSLLQTWQGSIELLESEQGTRFQVVLAIATGR